MNDHPHKRFRRLQDWAIMLTMIGTIGGMIVGSVIIINKHAAWMKVVDDAKKFDEEIRTEWHPQIIKNTQSIAVINTKLETLLEGQRRIENILLKRGSGWRSSTEGERNAG